MLASKPVYSPVRHYYGNMGPVVEDLILLAMSSPQAVRDAMRAYSDPGLDELLLFSCAPELEEVDRLADVVGRPWHSAIWGIE